MIKANWVKSCAAAVVVASMAFGAASAQTPPPDVRQKLIEQGWSRNPEVSKLMESNLAQMPKDGVKVTKDLAYGKHVRQRVDVYQAEGKLGLPIMVFFHGGGYTGGARDNTPYVHANVLTYFARNGFLGVNADFRLAPEFKWPSGGLDVAEIVRWLKQKRISVGRTPVLPHGFPSLPRSGIPSRVPNLVAFPGHHLASPRLRSHLIFGKTKHQVRFRGRLGSSRFFAHRCRLCSGGRRSALYCD